jgi:hypothetical protein
MAIARGKMLWAWWVEKETISAEIRSIRAAVSGEYADNHTSAGGDAYRG